MSQRSTDIKTPGPPRLEEVADGIWAYVQPDGTWWINNAGFSVGPQGQGAVAIDTCATERRSRAFVEAIASVTAAPVRTLINTHHHGDHTWGNAVFAAATIVAHERTRAEMLAFGPAREFPFWDNPDSGALPLEPPFLTYADAVTVHLGERRAEIRHVGTPAHTTNDSVVWFLEVATVFCGDLVFHGGTPFVLAFHDRGPLEANLDYLRFVQDVARRGRAAGLAPLQAARTPTSAGSRTGPTPNASSGTFTGPTQRSTAPSAVRRSMSWRPWLTWSPTTEVVR